MLSHVLRSSIGVAALLLAAASGSSQPAQQQPPPYQPPPQGTAPPPPQQQGGFGQGPPQGGEISSNDIVGWKAEAGTKEPLTPSFGDHARRYGCRIYNEDRWGLAAECTEGIIIFKQESTTVLIGCAKITEQQCRELFSRIVKGK